MPPLALAPAFASLPQPVLAAGAVVCLGLWAVGLTVRASQRPVWVSLAIRVLRAAVGAAGIFLGLEAGRQWLLPATDWPLWVPAAAAAVAVELVRATYELERRTVGRTAGRALVALRMLLALSVAFMLAQPVLRRGSERDMRRTVVLLVDRSASMHVPDNGMRVHERMRLAAFLWPDTFACPHELQEAADELGSLSEQFAARSEWLGMLSELGTEARAARLTADRSELEAELRAAEALVAEQVARCAQVRAAVPDLPEPAAQSLSMIEVALAEDAAASLAEASGLLQDPERIGDLRSLLERTSSRIAELEGEATETAVALDAAWYASLDEDRKAEVDSLAGLRRLELVARVLYGAPDLGDGGTPWPGLAGSLLESYGVKAYGFASEPEELAAGGTLSTNAESAELETDLAAALSTTATDMPAQRNAGVIFLTDGRHNALSLVKPAAARLATAGVPVSTVIVGAESPPTDAAVTSIEAPNAVYAGDRVHVSAELKLDGMGGRAVEVMLVGADTVVDTQTVHAEGDRSRTSVDLRAEPPGPGVHSYRVRIEPSEGEVLTANNEFPLSVSVTDDQVRMLVVEGRPRWEFRYLKNLFAHRDKTVRLQHVLMHPERIEGQALPSRVPASADRPPGQAEATALPETEDEWLKFDVVILGDVTPAELPLPAQEALRRFVVDRAGTLVAIAGRRAMPHEFAGMPLGDLLPVEAASPTPPEESEEGYHIALTPEGRRSLMLRLESDAQRNAEFWASRPPIFWRAPVVTTKPSASVLAFAQAHSVDSLERASLHAGVADGDREYQRAHPLIVAQQTGLGRVVFLAFDRTWRLRHREGDTYHHRFWGQLLRWATGGALPAGTTLVKLGTDQERYALAESVRVRARLLKPNLSPLLTNEAAVAVRRDGELVLRRRLEYIGDLPGMYSAELGALPSGSYTVELEGPDVSAALAREGVDDVSTSFSVDPAASSEQVELSADSGLPKALAAMTGGTAAPAWEAPSVIAALRPARFTVEERADYDLWSSWPLLAAMLSLATAEWVLRKRVGLP